MTDKERLDWLEKKGQGFALISDDQGHWCLVEDGMQTISDDPPDNCSTMFYVKKKQWKSTIRKAIDSEIKKQNKELHRR